MANREPSIATFIFTDIVDSTKIHDSLGDEGAQEILRTHNALMRAEIARHGGSEIKTMGDGFEIVFRSVTPALACAVDVQRAIARHNEEHPARKFMVRMGIHVGEAIEEEDEFFGTSVIIAARVSALAGPAEILTTVAVKQMAQGLRGIEYEDKGEFQLKGLREPYQLYRVISESVEKRRDAALRHPDFIGRETELTIVKEALEQVASGTGLFLLIVGEPGIGKTRLVEEAAQHSRSQGFRIWRGRCYGTEGSPAYTPIVEMLREYVQQRSEEALLDELGDDVEAVMKLVPELARRLPLRTESAPLPPEQERFRLLEGIRRLFEQMARRPLLLFVDDLQWADTATCILLRHLAATVANRPICVIGTCNEEHLPAGHPLTEVAAEFGRLRIYQRLVLKGLGNQDVRQLLELIGRGEPPRDLAETICEEAKGNPFFVTELINSLDSEGRLFTERGDWRRDFSTQEWEIPEGIRVVTQRRLNSLSDDARRVLSVASVMEKDFTFDLLEAVVDVSSELLLDAVDDALRMGMIDESKGAAARYRFAHGLTRQTLYGDLSSPRRERYHLRIGEAMEEIAPDEPEQIAHHFVQAGRSASPDKKRRYLILAADKASGAAAWEEAARYYGQALEQDGEIPQEDRAEFLRRRGEAQSGAGDWEGAVDSLGQAISLFDSLGERERAGWVAFSLRRLYGARGQFDKASEVVQQALTLLGDGDSEIRSRLLAQAGFFRSAFGEVEDAERLLAQSAEMAARLESPAAIGFAAFIRGMHCLSYSRLAEAAESLQKGAEWSLTGNDLWTASLSSSFRRRMLFSLGDLAEAEGSPEEQERLARRAGNFLAFCETKWLASVVACLHGDLERAEALAVEVLDLIEASHAVSGEPGALINLAYIRFLRGGDHPDFEEPLLRAIEVYDQMSAAPTDDPRPVLLLLRALAGRLDEARKTLPQFERYFRFEDPWTASLGEARLTLAVALVVLREKELARSLYEPLKGWTESSEYVLTGLASIPQLVNRVLGMLADICDAPEEALAYFDTAISQAREIGIRSELAEACYWWASSLLRDGTPTNKERANDLLAEACTIWEQAGMPNQVKRASGLAAAAPGSPPSPA